MKKVMSGRLQIFLLLICIAFLVDAGEQVHWDYSGENGPNHWAELNPAFKLCRSGKNQSPINLTAFVDADLKALQMHYASKPKEIMNNGHTVQVNYYPGSVLHTDGIEFKLLQFHFHSPSENHLNNRSFPAEIHYVHADKDGNLAVIGVFIEMGDANPALESLWHRMPENPGDTHELAKELSIDKLMPANKEYYRFTGSLTTPPCTEGVRWFMLKYPVSASNLQIERIVHTLHEPNNRPIQPINARLVVE